MGTGPARVCPALKPHVLRAGQHDMQEHRLEAVGGSMRPPTCVANTSEKVKPMAVTSTPTGSSRLFTRCPPSAYSASRLRWVELRWMPADAAPSRQTNGRSVGCTRHAPDFKCTQRVCAGQG